MLMTPACSVFVDGRGKPNLLDMGSLLIKPVQRVMKYPLLLGELWQATPEDHPDNRPMKEALAEAKIINLNINEFKRRKDIGKPQHPVVSEASLFTSQPQTEPVMQALLSFPRSDLHFISHVRTKFSEVRFYSCIYPTVTVKAILSHLVQVCFHLSAFYPVASCGFICLGYEPVSESHCLNIRVTLWLAMRSNYKIHTPNLNRCQYEHTNLIIRTS